MHSRFFPREEIKPIATIPKNRRTHPATLPENPAGSTAFQPAEITSSFCILPSSFKMARRGAALDGRIKLLAAGAAGARALAGNRGGDHAFFFLICGDFKEAKACRRILQMRFASRLV